MFGLSNNHFSRLAAVFVAALLVAVQMPVTGFLTPNAAFAQTAEGTLLTVAGKSTVDGVEISATYDLAALQALPKTSFVTTTAWSVGPQSFEGVLLKTFLEQHGITKGTIFATAINDYVVEIPVSDAINGGPIIAYALNGAPMSVRDKGPLWLVYPFDQNPDYQTEVVYSRSIWQLDRMTYVP